MDANTADKILIAVGGVLQTVRHEYAITNQMFTCPKQRSIATIGAGYIDSNGLGSEVTQIIRKTGFCEGVPR